MRLQEIPGFPGRMPMLRLQQWWKKVLYLVEGDAKRYIPIVPQEFCGNRIRRLEKELEWLQQNLPSESVEEDGYITVEGKKNIADKIHHLLTGAEERVYFFLF